MSFFKGVLAHRQTSRSLYKCLFVREFFINDVKLGILILIKNMVLKIQNDVIIRKQIANISAMQKHLEGILNADVENGIKIQN